MAARVEELETLPAGTKPKTSYRRSPGGDSERRRERQRSTNLPFLFPSIPKLERLEKKEKLARATLNGRDRDIVNQTSIGKNIGETSE